MQPYLFPYLGYYQLVNCVDTFILYDDVNYIKGGYINRNSILVKNKAQRFTLPVPSASSNKKIMDLSFSSETRKTLSTIQQAYSKAPYFEDVYPLIKSILESKDRNIAEVCRKSIALFFEYLAIEKSIIKSSNLDYDRNLPAVDRLVGITRKLQAKHYINSIGGQALYNKNNFSEHQIKLSFIKMDEIKYYQFQEEFIPNLSIIDILMWCDKEKIKSLLTEYKLI